MSCFFSPTILTNSIKKYSAKSIYLENSSVGKLQVGKVVVGKDRKIEKGKIDKKRRGA